MRFIRVVWYFYLDWREKVVLKFLEDRGDGFLLVGWLRNCSFLILTGYKGLRWCWGDIRFWVTWEVKFGE